MNETPSSQTPPIARRQLRVVVVEDNVQDAEIIVRELRNAGFGVDWIRVENEAQYLAALEPLPDLITCDYSLPSFDGLLALDLLVERELEIPFILISGTIGEEKAATAIQRGADDYLLKDRLTRLGPAVHQALEIRQARQERKLALESLHRSERAYRQLVHALPIAMYSTDAKGRIILSNDAAVELWGWRPNPESDLFSGAFKLFSLDGTAIPADQWPTARVLKERRGIVGAEYILERPDTTRRHVLSYPHPVNDENGSLTGAVSVLLDITELKQTQQALLDSKIFSQAIIDSVTARICVLDADGKIVAVNLAWQEYCLQNHPRPEECTAFVGTNYLNNCQGAIGPDNSDATAMAAGIRDVMDGKLAEFTLEYPCQNMTEQRWFHARVTAFQDGSRNVVVAHVDVTERKHAQNVLEASEEEQRNLVCQLKAERARLVAAQRVAKVGSWETDLSTFELSWSEETYRIHETDPSICGLTHQRFIAMIHPADREAVDLAFYKSLDQHQPNMIEHRLLLADGRIKHVEERWQIVFDAHGNALRAVGTCQDVTERKLQEQRVARLSRVQVLLSGINALIVRARDLNELFRDACEFAINSGGFHMSFVGIIDESTGKVVIAASAGKSEDILTLTSETLASNDKAPSSMVMNSIREKRALVSNDARNDPKLLLGAEYVQAGVRSLAILPLLIYGEAVGVFVLYSNVTDFFHDEEMKLLREMAGNVAFSIDHIKKGERLNYLAYYDELTGLPNRTLFLDRVDQCIRASAAAGMGISMVVLDVDRFSQINDQLGRSAGDALLLWVAARLTQTLGDANLLMRVGGDRFALVISAELQEAGVLQFMDRAGNALRDDPLIHEGVVIRIAAKFGVAQFPEDGPDAETLLKHAKVALKLAKSSSEMIAYFSNEMDAQSSQRLVLVEQMRVAIDAGQFVLHYQPKVDMISGEIVGAEALIRWQHPDKGLLPPATFIAIAEEAGLILPIGAWVIDSVCAQQAKWIAAGCRVVPIAVNVSAVQLTRKDFLNTVRNALSKHSISSKLLDLELTESALMNNEVEAAEVLLGLRELGCGLALDDFGTGYSSPAYLKRFAFDSVKIDRTFIMDITHNAGDAAIATAIIAMAQSLHLKVVAEGVETIGQFNYLRAQGCDQIQGYLFSRPVPEDVFASDLQSARRMQIPSASAKEERTLLLVDDEPNISAALFRLLRRDGYRILIASGGAEALELLASNAVQVIISDQRMPEMSGTQFLDTVRKMYPNTIRMILSGYTDLQVVTESVNRGAVFKFLTKPWDDDQLREHVRDAFRRLQTEVKH